jgi:hypothetical protein
MADPFATEPRPVATRSRLPAHTSEGQPVTLTGIDIPFGDMVVFMVKWSIAAIPAAFILLLTAAVVGLLLGALFGPFF